MKNSIQALLPRKERIRVGWQAKNLPTRRVEVRNVYCGSGWYSIIGKKMTLQKITMDTNKK